MSVIPQFIKQRQIIFLNEKKILYFDIKIDDSPKNLENAKKKILFSAYHNLEIPNKELKKENIIRVNNWQEIRDILL